jgi:hypothetical protein
MTPFPGKRATLAQTEFNYRLSRARRIVENAFGVLAARWRVFLNRIDLCPQNAKSVVKGALALHNFCQVSTTPAQVTCPLQEVENERVEGLVNLQRTGNRGAMSAVQVRSAYMQYFTQHRLPWQLTRVQRGRGQRQNVQ